MTVVAASVCGGRLKLMAQTGTSDEDELVALAQTADDAGFEQLIVRHGPRLRSLLDRITREPEAAQDAFLEAVLRAWQNIDRFHARSSFSTWLTRIAINETYRALGRRDAAALPLDDAVGERIPSWGGQSDEVFESREFLAAVDSALGRLPSGYRAAVVLRDVEGLSTRAAPMCSASGSVPSRAASTAGGWPCDESSTRSSLRTDVR